MKSVFQILLLNISFIQVFGCLNCFKTTLSDFNKGARFELTKPTGLPANDMKSGECKEMESCSTGDEFKMEGSARFSWMRVRNDVKFLYYTVGAVNYCTDDAPERKWILSGDFSGCLMSVVRNVNDEDQRLIGHVDTSALAKDSCKKLMKNKYGKERKGLNEFFHPFPTTKEGEGDRKLEFENFNKFRDGQDTMSPPIKAYGLVSPTGDFYTIWAIQHPEKYEWRIVSDTPMKQKASDISEINDKWEED